MQVLDGLLSNYELSQTVKKIQSFINLDSASIQEFLNELLEEKIISSKNQENETLYFANFYSLKTRGLFQYYRVVLNENLSDLKSIQHKS